VVECLPTMCKTLGSIPSINKQTNKQTHTYIHIYIHTYIYTYIHTYIHSYIKNFQELLGWWPHGLAGRVVCPDRA
jgi:hypothetical protein